MKKLFVSVLVACLMVTYTTTAYACQEEVSTEVTPIDDDDIAFFPFDPYSN